MSVLHYIAPWEFAPSVVACIVLAALLYARGIHATRRAGERVGFWRPFAFFLGLLLCYVVMQTYFDYYASRTFFLHRLQHLVLHHIGPFLIALSAPHVFLARGLPRALREGAPARAWNHPVTRAAWLALQNPVVAPLLFVGLIWFWLQPEVHFYAMISTPLYWTMNLSMLVDGLLFWWLMLDPRPVQHGRTLGHGTRLLVLVGVMFPQILIGSSIVFAPRELYSVYDVCGRILPISPMNDQRYGGLITWIPAAMMSVIGSLVVLRQLLHAEPAHDEPAEDATDMTVDGVQGAI